MASEFTEFSLYGGKAKGKFFPGSHQYWVNGKRKTGVTTYLGIIDKSRPLVIWATELYRDYQVFEAKFIDEEPTNIERDFSAFLNAKALHEWNKATDFYKNK